MRDDSQEEPKVEKAEVKEEPKPKKKCQLSSTDIETTTGKSIHINNAEGFVFLTVYLI